MSAAERISPGTEALSSASTMTDDTVVDAPLILASLNKQMNHLPVSPLESANIIVLVAHGSPLGIRVYASKAPSLSDLRVESMPRRALPNVPLTFDIAPRRAFSTTELFEAAEFTRSLLSSTRILAVLRQRDEAGTGIVDLPLLPMLATRSAARPGISVSFSPVWGRTRTEIDAGVTRAARVVISPPEYCGAPLCAHPATVLVGANHDPREMGRLTAAAKIGDLCAMVSALCDGCSTEEGALDWMMRPIDICRPIVLAARHDRADIVTFLLRVGANPAARIYFGYHSISDAAARNFPAVVAVLLGDSRVDINALATSKDGDSRSALHMAACYGHTSVVKLLLADPRLDINAVASIATKLISACTAHTIALGQGFVEIVSLIENDPRFRAMPLSSTDSSLRQLSSPFIWGTLDIRIPKQILHCQ